MQVANLARHEVMLDCTLLPFTNTGCIANMWTWNLHYICLANARNLRCFENQEFSHSRQDYYCNISDALKDFPSPLLYRFPQLKQTERISSLIMDLP